MARYEMTWAEVRARFDRFIYPAVKNLRPYGIPRGGLCVAAMCGNAVDAPEVADIFVDDIIDSGRTRDRYREQYAADVLALVDKQSRPEDRQLGWVVFPWERATEERGAEDNVVRLLQHVGENVEREGLKNTPAALVSLLDRMTVHTLTDVATIIHPTVTHHGGGYVELPAVKFWSLCEHHLMPFFGVVRVLYQRDAMLADIGDVVALVDAVSRRLQTQERMGEQITYAIEQALSPKGVAVVIDATHTCVAMRGDDRDGHLRTTYRRGFLDETMMGSTLQRR